MPPAFMARLSATVLAPAGLGKTLFLPKASPAYFPADAIVRLSADDLSVIDRFFARAIDIDLASRQELAERLAQHMTSKIGVETLLGVTPEHILESIALSLRSFR